jgi:hypothetical protein
MHEMCSGTAAALDCSSYQRSETRCLRLESSENITFILKAEIAGALDHDGLFTLAAVVISQVSSELEAQHKIYCAHC